MLPPLTARLYWQRRLALALSISVILVLMLLLLRRFEELQRDAEATALEQIERGLRQAVFAQSMRVLAEHGAPALAAQVGANPMPWTDWPGRGGIQAIGEPTRDAAVDFPEGWRFDPRRGEVVFSPRWLQDGERRWRVEAVFLDHNGNGRFDPPVEVARELRLAPVAPQ